MAQLYTQCSQQGVWMTAGPPTSVAVQLAQPITLVYDDGTQQSLAAHTPAIAPSGGTQVDRTGVVWVVYVTKTDATLRLQPEQQLAAISGDYAPLARVLVDRVVPYQPQQPGGTAIKTGAWSGGAVLGSARSWCGGASASGVAWWPAQGNQESQAGTYLYCSSYPASQTSLYDFDAGGSGYMRTSITSAGHIICEWANAGQTHSTDLGALPLAEWCFLMTYTYINVGNNDGLDCAAYLWNQAGSIIASSDVFVPGMATNRGSTAYSVTLSVGRPGSGGYAAAPNNSTLRLSKLRNRQCPFNCDNVWVTPTGVDQTGDRDDYNAERDPGPATQLDDSGSENHPLLAGAQGLTILSSGPY
jgi:hypothetical protein